jgi:hypothetical protein
VKYDVKNLIIWRQFSMVEVTANPGNTDVADMDSEAAHDEIKVIIRLPVSIDERVRQRKINEIYDILCPVEVS